VLGAQVHEGQQVDARNFLDVTLVTRGDGVSERAARYQAEQQNADESQPAGTQRIPDPLMRKSHCKRFSHDPTPKSGAH
jgi:hypothetical protein